MECDDMHALQVNHSAFTTTRSLHGFSALTAGNGVSTLSCCSSCLNKECFADCSDDDDIYTTVSIGRRTETLLLFVVSVMFPCQISGLC
jgi:hypothetical protein